ncbi:MAG: replicative DNA helicase [Planctomycetes bacterium]|jgi:replicative DNA helicase|nr:replicative DNA helicase [Planctomycetota bacterium]
MDNETLPGRTPPHNDDAERAVLGALLLSPERIADVSEFLRAEDFFARRHVAMFECLLDLYARGGPIDFLTVGEALRASGRFQAIGGAQALADMAMAVTSAAHVVAHARIVADNATLRRLAQSATEILEEAHNTQPDGEAVKLLLDSSEARIFQLAGRTVREGADSVRSVLEETFKVIEARTHRDTIGLKTGYYELDEKLCGLNRGDMIIVAARPSMGKTAFALNLVEGAAMQLDERLGRKPTVLFFSLEMGKQAIVQRMLCSRARVDAHKLRTGRIPDEDYGALMEAAGELGESSIFIDDTPGLSVMALRGRARRVKARHGLDLIVLDYLQLMTHPKSESRQLEISEISRSLKALARELDVPVIALSQLSRAVEGKDRNPRGWPMLSDLRESGSIEQDADIVMMLYREEYYAVGDVPEEVKGKATIIIAKHRNGPTGQLLLNFRPSIMRFENPAPSAAEPIYA